MQLIADNFNWQDFDVAPERTKVVQASTLADEVINLFYGPDEAKGEYLPWDKATNHGLRIRSREVTVYAGINGHYKSTVSSQIALHLLRQDQKAMIASFEMRPAQTMQRMSRQAGGCAEPGIAFLRKFHQWTDDRLWIYDYLGNCEPRKILAVCRYAAGELGIKHIFIDSLMKVVAGTDDYTAQKQFIGDLQTIALGLDIHIHIVAHARKSAAETDHIDKFSVKGASEIGDQTDNLVLVQRNKLKEKAKDKGDADDGKPDVFYTVAKQRNGAYEGVLGFWFNQDSMTFVEKPSGSWPRIYLGDEDGVVDAPERRSAVTEF